MAMGAALIPYYNQLIEILETNPELKRSGRGICKQVAWVAGGTAIGGVLAGPAGALVGGVIGCVIGYKTSTNYQAMVRVVKNLSDEEKQQLVKQVQDLVGSIGIMDLIKFTGSSVQREALLCLIRNFRKTKGAG